MTTHRPSKRRWQALALAAAVTALPWLQGCTTNPATGEQNLSFVSQEEERRLGAEAHPKILQQFGGEYKERVGDVGRLVVSERDSLRTPPQAGPMFDATMIGPPAADRVAATTG